MRPPILIVLLWLLNRPWPEWLQAKFRDTPISYHANGDPCSSRWCEQGRHW